MSRQARLLIGVCAAAAALLGSSLALPASAAGPDPQTALIEAQIEAGEFAPALAGARATQQPEEHDAWLAQIAEAQAGAGARDASLRTLAEVYDDRTRTEALSRMADPPMGGRGGSSSADFDSLIDLMTTTVEPDSWDTVGGPGSVANFETGVRVDAQGVLQQVLRGEDTGSLAALRAQSAAGGGRGGDARQASPLRKVSLSRLEKHVQLRIAAGRRPTETMQVLAGLQRIEYVFIYPQSRDVVLAGPAGDWCRDLENRIVSSQTGQPVVQLDDLVVVLRQMTGGGDTKFGCRIDPRQEATAQVKAYAEELNRLPSLPPARLWVEQLRSLWGKQDIAVYGLDPRTRAAQVLVEADYRMKLVGMGLEKGVPGVLSYLDSIDLAPGESPPAMKVLRWCFILNYQAVLASEDRQSFAIRGQGVKVLSENELLAATGQRVATGESEPLTRLFAQSFTEHFGALCEKYTIYADLRNICDLALVGALIRAEDLPGRVGWYMSYFGDPAAYQVALGPAPKEVETVANFRMIRSGNKLHTVAGVSGGVRVDPAALVARQAIEVDHYGELSSRHSRAEPEGQLPLEAWWWD